MTASFEDSFAEFRQFLSANRYPDQVIWVTPDDVILTGGRLVSGTASVALSGTLQHAPAMLSASGSRIASYAVTDGEHVYYIGSEQHVHQLYYGGSWIYQDLTAFTNAPLAASGSSGSGRRISTGWRPTACGSRSSTPATPFAPRRGAC